MEYTLEDHLYGHFFWLRAHTLVMSVQSKMLLM